MTPEEAVADLKRMAGPGLEAAMRQPFDAGARAIRADAIRAIKSKGIGRRVFQEEEPEVEVSFKASPTGAPSVEIVARGIPKMMETGDRTKPHVIAPRDGGRVLVLKDGLRTGFVSGEVNHPGGQIRKDPSIEPAIERNEDGIAKGLEVSISRFVGV